MIETFDACYIEQTEKNSNDFLIEQRWMRSKSFSQWETNKLCSSISILFSWLSSGFRRRRRCHSQTKHIMNDIVGKWRNRCATMGTRSKEFHNFTKQTIHHFDDVKEKRKKAARRQYVSWHLIKRRKRFFCRKQKSHVDILFVSALDKRGVWVHEGMFENAFVWKKTHLQSLLDAVFFNH